MLRIMLKIEIKNLKAEKRESDYKEKINIKDRQAYFDDSQKYRDKFDNIIMWILTYIITSSLIILVNKESLLYSKFYIISFIISFISLCFDLFCNYFGSIRNENLSKYEIKNEDFIKTDEHYHTIIKILNKIYYISFISSILFTIILTLYKIIIS